ncbi:hypothetical protein MKX01_005643 [Papaver californicum]|nr:hypothetical protein MKX01_005643 [Papaver californicum]
MKVFIFRPEFSLPIQTNLKTPTPTTDTKFLHLLPFRTKSSPLSNSSPPQIPNLLTTRKATTLNKKLQNLELTKVPSKSTTKNNEIGLSSVAILVAVTLGVAILFWDNMKRYSLYIITVSTGVIYTMFQPVLELLKNLVVVILIITILGGSFFIISQVLSAMVGVSEFVYDYGY